MASLSPPKSAASHSEAIRRGLEQLDKVRELQDKADHHGGSQTLLRSKSTMLHGIKRKVSKKKRRFEAKGLSLDLTYITDRIIAMGFPSSGVEAMYRNDMRDVREFLDSRHGDNYKVYNLCSEKEYDPSNFYGRVFRYPFDDHNCPPFDSIHGFLRNVDEWLAQDHRNVVVIHCKAGKGRTGVTIATYLLYCGMWETAEEALGFYGIVRTHNSKGVTIPSQRRWVGYYEQYMALQSRGLELPRADPLRLTRIYVSANAPKYDILTVRCDAESIKVSSSEWKHRWKVSSTTGGEWLNFEPLELTFRKDVLLLFKAKKLLKKPTKFGCWFNTQFIQHGYLKLSKEDLDKVNKNKKAADFYIELFFNTYDAKKVEIDLRLNREEQARRNDIVENMKEHFGFEGSDVQSSQTSEDEGDLTDKDKDESKDNTLDAT